MANDPSPATAKTTNKKARRDEAPDADEIPDLDKPSETSDAIEDMEGIEIPDEVLEAFGGLPIPPPPATPTRPQVARVGERMPSRPDPGGLLSAPSPTARSALRKIDQARNELRLFVEMVEGKIGVVADRIEKAAEYPEACESDGFDLAHARKFVAAMSEALEAHFG